MSLVTLTVPKEYGYVVAATASTFFLGTWLGFRIGAFRRAAKVPYPQVFADGTDMAAAETPEAKKALYLFNCAQRSHAHYLESQASVALAALLSGLRYPLFSAGVTAAWVVARVVYALGYTRRDKDRGQGRLAGFIAAFLASHALFAAAAWTGVKLVL